MSHTISIRTISIFAAIIGIIAIALMSAYGNPAQGQSLPSVEFTQNTITIHEPDQSPHRVNVTFTVALSQVSTQTVTVWYASADHTATATTRDYIPASGTLYFNPGITQRTVSFTVLDDTIVEDSTERFYVELSQPSNAVLGTRYLVAVFITDDDESAPYNLTAPATVREDQGTFTVRVATASSPVVDIEADFYIYDLPGTAREGVDYQNVSKILFLDPGERGAEFEVTLRNDADDEADKSFTLNLRQNGPGHPQINLGITELTVTILDDDPATPTNLELASQTTDDDLGHVAVLQWDYSDAEGYLLESRDGTSGTWNCIVAGTYSSREPTGTSTVSSTRGGAMDASQDWHFRVRNFTSQQFSYPGEATCDENADYGYIFSTVADQGYNLSPADTLGPVAIPAIDPTVRPTWQPTGLTIAAGAKHRDVTVSWDEPPDGSNVTGFALYRKWQGDSNTPHLCLYWSTKTSEFITSYRDYAIAAYDTTDNKNQYVYTVYPLNDAVTFDLEAQGGCDDYEPTSVPSISATATLAISTDIFPNSGGDLEYPDAPAPTGLTLTTKVNERNRGIGSMIRASWDDVSSAPGYKARWRKTGETAWRDHSRSRHVEYKKETGLQSGRYNNCTGVPRFQDEEAQARGAGVEDGDISSGLGDGSTRVWCLRQNAKLLTRVAETWPPMYNAGPDKPNDNSAGTGTRMILLDRNQQHEVQVATCTDLSCASTGAWSSSAYAYSR